MELDKRIKSLSDILTCFDIEDAKQYIGQEGYFADVNSSYHKLDDSAYGTLTAIKDNAYPFKMGNNDIWRFFIPESRLLEIKEKKFRPYTIEEFQKIFTLGSPIKFRRKDAKEHPVNLVFLGYTWLNDRTAVEIGHEKYFLDVLLNDFEWYNEYKDEYTPFGVEEWN